MKSNQKCQCGCGRRAVAVHSQKGRYYGSWACANHARRLATEPHDTAPDGTVRFRYLPTASELAGRGFTRLSGKYAERWLMPAECKGGKRGRFYINRFRGELITTRGYACYSKVDFESFLEQLAGVGQYPPLRPSRCGKRERAVKDTINREIENIVFIDPEVLEFVRKMQLTKSIATTLSRLCQQGTLCKFKPLKTVKKGPRIAYGLPQWVGVDGRPLPAYRDKLAGYKRF